jgi:hypothetical protein
MANPKDIRREDQPKEETQKGQKPWEKEKDKQK